MPNGSHRPRPARTLTYLDLIVLCFWSSLTDVPIWTDFYLYAGMSHVASAAALFGSVVSVVGETHRMLGFRQMSALGIIHRSVVLLSIALLLSSVGITVSKYAVIMTTLYSIGVQAALLAIKLATVFHLQATPSALLTSVIFLCWINVAVSVETMMRHDMKPTAALYIAILVMWTDNFLLRCNLT